jgi:hypothetical protein
MRRIFNKDIQINMYLENLYLKDYESILKEINGESGKEMVVYHEI